MKLSGVMAWEKRADSENWRGTRETLDLESVVMVVALEEEVFMMLPRESDTLAVLGKDWPSRAVREYVLYLLVSRKVLVMAREDSAPIVKVLRRLLATDDFCRLFREVVSFRVTERESVPEEAVRAM